MRTLEDLLELNAQCTPDDEDFRNRRWPVCRVGEYLLECGHSDFHTFFDALANTALDAYDDDPMESLAAVFLRGFMLGQRAEREQHAEQ